MANKNNAKFVFYYLLSLTALIFLAISVGMIAYGIINELVADTLVGSSYYNSFNSQYKFAISAIIISAPLFYLLTGLIRKGIKKGEMESDSPVRRWLTYFILFISSLFILGSFIGVISSFLEGELTARFILKTLTVFIISGITFAYYFYDIKTEKIETGDKWIKVFLFSSLAIVLAAFISVWFFIESPKVARNRKFDQVTVNKLSNLEGDINSYYAKNEKLPELISDFVKERQILSLKENNIEYIKKGDKNFELCATFLSESEDLTSPYNYRSDSYSSHEIGYQCFPGELWFISDTKEVMQPEMVF